ncbi:glutaredoxin family protein [bacterium]|jgi:glutaredoxin 3|nr:glutaredoxin family protein [bacterium]MDB4576219.1 glutaredoxin family protein [bacterium]|tara:strand:+ start:375 stop:617 length:243 start_codon:yes stop_codon:yes gene_type:complete
MKYEVYGTPVCGYCVQAKRLLEDRELNYRYFDLSNVDEAKQDKLMEIAGFQFRTVPQIFTVEDGERKYVGGYTELNESLK